MKQSLGISIVGVALLVQLMFLPTRSLFAHGFGKDYPRMPLPIATNAIKGSSHSHEQVSWTRTGGWVASGVGSIREDDLEDFLKKSVKRCEVLGINSRVRVRIPPDAPAGEFVHLAMSMQRAGVQGFVVAVVAPGGRWF